ncbi:1,4-dihydroxy-2-naphthoate polyprenyltransferase [Blastococcus sp. MG754426]|uniref:1,4-dihydroxy-2-naphthoate polyprenyltransferase n=1 Tax=unclassified Blastococcus TaxID=2619396 RepID=UPI001EF06CFB|nr:MULTISPECIES: 1,4-dihydroxy-2-naphthoate polyprenyltransferase [unclassified Blastococcus]MCF6510022.1 1,4-dihydroxy-2-naphthoate polyprenyltransferase [Blastococcus sp. MG754426]MCF6514407.1 1,4-dihydroxy-2-naphthoate polyprenyltransferase [Blastococcus sp. MG754427]MCF6737449.1 1,4-dihydroxy-2-naphthoate polyprenyltransferase [Blastococcus sp. KM273129]
MATPAQWLAGARPRTLPAAVAPVLVGTGAAIALDGFRLVPALLALVVALALQVGVNYANDHSDGKRGTDADRVGPMRLVGSGAATARQVLVAALAAFAVAGVAGLALAALSSWWLVAVGAVCIAAAWTYTGGPLPYGYRALGEVFVFVFFGPVAVVGTTYVQTRTLPGLAFAVSVPVGLLIVAILVANNLRDIEGDARVGKRTLAVLLGDRGTRLLYAALLAVPFAVVAAVGVTRPWALLALAAAPLALGPARTVLAGARGPALIAVLASTGLLTLATGVLLAAGLALS